MTRKQTTLLALPGDGVGPEVVAEVLMIAAWLTGAGVPLRVISAPWGLEPYRQTGQLLPAATAELALAADAVLCGAMGGPEYESIDATMVREQSILGLRKLLRTCCNVRPTAYIPGIAAISPMKPEVLRGVDLVFVRELLGGAYYTPVQGIRSAGCQSGAVAFELESYSHEEIVPVATFAFELARSRRRKVTLVDKSNVTMTGRLWRQEVRALAAQSHGDIKLEYMLVDNAALQLVRNPSQFDVILTNNSFGDILSDIGGGLLGSLGMLPSASFSAPGAGGKVHALYEPVHGSAPDIAGRGIANPLGAILSFAMFLRHTAECRDEAEMLESAVLSVLAEGAATADIARPGARPLSTAEMGKAVLASLREEWGRLRGAA